MNREEMKQDLARTVRHSTTYLMLLCATMLSLALLSSCKKEEAPETAAVVQAEHPEEGSISNQITADAVLAPLAQAAIAPKITAPIRKFYVERGAHVKEGQLLVTLENNDLAAAALDNQGSYESAQAAYESATKAQVPVDELKADAELTQARQALDLNKSIVESRKKLFAEGAIPGRDVDTAQGALLQAQAAYDVAAKQAQFMHSGGHEAALKAAKGQLTSAEGKYKGAAAGVAYSEIHSPINGVVTDRPLFAGETAAAGAPVITVMDTSSLIAKTHIAQSMAQQLKVGSAATVKVPGIEDPVDAKVSMVSPALDPGSTTVEVWLRIDNRAGKLKAGTPVKVSITGQTIEKALKVPLTSIMTADDGSKVVMVIGADSTTKKKPVAVGITDGEDIQVLTGVTTADMVITGGGYGLDNGAKVKIGKADDDDDDAKPGAAKDDDDAKPGAAKTGANKDDDAKPAVAGKGGEKD